MFWDVFGRLGMCLDDLGCFGHFGTFLEVLGLFYLSTFILSTFLLSIFFNFFSFLIFYFSTFQIFYVLVKQNGVGPVHNRPSTDEFHHFVQKTKKQKNKTKNMTCDK